MGFVADVVRAFSRLGLRRSVPRLPTCSPGRGGCRMCGSRWWVRIGLPCWRWMVCLPTLCRSLCCRCHRPRRGRDRAGQAEGPQRQAAPGEVRRRGERQLAAQGHRQGAQETARDPTHVALHATTGRKAGVRLSGLSDGTWLAWADDAKCSQRSGLPGDIPRRPLAVFCLIYASTARPFLEGPWRVADSAGDPQRMV